VKKCSRRQYIKSGIKLLKPVIGYRASYTKIAELQTITAATSQDRHREVQKQV
jgi:hypothetical protein